MPRGVYERKPVVDRFWEKVEKNGKDGCWEWQAGKHRQGYGSFWFERRLWRSHRFCWTLHFGEIPEGMCVLHDCDNPGCVNPEHLFLGTHKDNSQDASKKGRFPDRRGLNPGEAHGRSKLTEEQVLSIRKEYKTGNITQAELARKYNVSQATICQIVTRQTWKHI